MSRDISRHGSPLPREDPIMNINRIATQISTSDNDRLVSTLSSTIDTSTSLSSNTSTNSLDHSSPSTANSSPSSNKNGENRNDYAHRAIPYNSPKSPPTISELLNSTARQRRISQFQNICLSSTSDLNTSLKTEEKVSKEISNKPLALDDFLYRRGFLEGVCFDVTIMCFGQTYKLHKLILSRSPFFASLVSSTWATSCCERSESVKSIFEVDFGYDENVTREAFELALARLYGHKSVEKEKTHVYGLLAVANFLDLPDIVEDCVFEIIKSIGPETVSLSLTISSKYDYGKAGRQIVDACKTYLLTEGYELSNEIWADVPTAIAAEVISADGFFIPTEWDRVQFLVLLYRNKISRMLAKRDRKGATSRISKSQVGDLFPLREALNFKIHYCHLSYDQLDMLEHLKDHRGLSLIDRESLRNALWLQTGLRHKISNAPVDLEELGLSHPLPDGLLKKEDEKKGVGIGDDGADDLSTGTKFSCFRKSARGKSDEDLASIDIQEFESGSDDDEYTFPYYPVPSDEDGLDIMQSERKATISANKGEYQRITKFPPFRFSVKFDDIAKLRADKRVYSKTYWYAGSYWNIYIQKVQHKKGHQLGVYLHRSKVDASVTVPSSRARMRHRFSGFESGGTSTKHFSGADPSTSVSGHQRSQSLFFESSSNDARGTPDINEAHDRNLYTHTRFSNTGLVWHDPTIPEIDNMEDLNNLASMNPFGAIGGNISMPMMDDSTTSRQHDLNWNAVTSPSDRASLIAYSLAREVSLGNNASGLGATTAVAPAATTVNGLANMFENSTTISYPSNSNNTTPNIGNNLSNNLDNNENTLNNTLFKDAINNHNGNGGTGNTPTSNINFNSNSCNTHNNNNEAAPEYLDKRHRIQAYFEI